MSKLFSLRDWFYLEDAAKHMSARFNEPVTVKDLFALALDGRLTLSLRFASSISVIRAVASGAQPDGNWGKEYLNDSKTFYLLEHEVTWVDGLFDLPLALGNTAVLRATEWDDSNDRSWAFDEMLLVNSAGEFMVPVALKNDIEAAFDEVPFNDCRRYNFHYSLPDDCRFVVKTVGICQLETSLEKEKTDAISSRERTNLLNIIGALLEHVNGKESALIATLLERHKDKPGIKERTLQEKFAAAKRSLASS